jgi:hypothetical protein
MSGKPQPDSVVDQFTHIRGRIPLWSKLTTGNWNAATEDRWPKFLIMLPYIPHHFHYVYDDRTLAGRSTKESMKRARSTRRSGIDGHK